MSVAPPKETDIQIQTKSLTGFYSAGALRDIIPIYPLYSVMFISHGITPFELSLLFIIWALVGIFLEVPSGALADAFSRKWLIVFSGVLKSSAFLSWFLWQDFWGYALGFVLWGIGSTFRSGAFEALLYESLRSWHRSSDFAYHFSRIRSLGTICVLLGEASGGLLISYGYDFVLLVSAAVPVLVSIPLVLYVQDTERSAPGSHSGYMRDAFYEARHNPVLLMILLVSTFLLTVHGIFDEYVPPLFQQHGFSLEMIAYLAIPIFSAQALGEYLADRVTAGGYNQQLSLVAAGSLFLLPAALFDHYWGVVALTVFFFAFGLARTLLETQLQDSIQGDARATVTSIIGLGDSVGAIFWFLLFGLVAQWTSFAGATVFLSLATVVLCLVAGRFLKMLQ